MKYRRLTHIFIYAVVFLFCLSGVSKANPNISESLYQEGLNLMAAGQYTEAAHELARALLLEIDHTAARKNLMDLQKMNALSVEVRNLIRQYGELYALLEVQQRDIQDLLSKRAELEDDLILKGVPQEKIKNRLYYWEELAFKNKNRTQESLQRKLELERDPLKLLNGYMQLEKEKKFNKLSYLEQQYDDLINLKYMLASEGIENTQTTMDIVHTEKFYDIRGNPRYASGTKPVLRFQNFQDLKNHMVLQGERIEKLSDQIVDLTLRISEKEMREEFVQEVVEPSRELSNMQAEEWQSRFELSERIIKRKDEQIQNLEESLSEYKNLLQEKEFLHAKKLQEKESMIETLGEELFALNVKVARLKKDRLAFSRKQLRKMAGKRMERMEGQLAVKTSKVEELEGVLKLYKDLLSDTTKTSREKDLIIKEKDVMIGSLRSDIGRLQNDIARKDDSLDGHLENLKTLQSQVSAMQEQVAALEESDEANPFASPALEERVSNMKAQLNDLNQFIENELRRNSWSNLN